MGANTKIQGKQIPFRLLSKHVTHSLKYYEMVERTTQDLISVDNGARQLRQDVQNQLYAVQKNPDIANFSNDGDGEEALEDAERLLKDFISLLKKKRQAAYEDPNLHGGNQEMVTSSYDQAIRSLSEVHNLMVDLRWQVMECEADRSEAKGPFETWEEFMTALKEEQ